MPFSNLKQNQRKKRRSYWRAPTQKKLTPEEENFMLEKQEFGMNDIIE